MTLQHTIPSHWALHYPHKVVPWGPSTPALAFSALTNLRYAFTFKTLNYNLKSMVNTEFHCVQFFIRYIRRVMTLMLDKVPCSSEYGHVVCCILRIVE